MAGGYRWRTDSDKGYLTDEGWWCGGSEVKFESRAILLAKIRGERRGWSRVDKIP